MTAADPLAGMGGAMNRRAADRFLAEAVPSSHLARRLIDLRAASSEPVEALSGLMALAWAGVLLLQPDVFATGATYSAMAELAPQQMWGLGALMLAAAQLGALLGRPIHREAASLLAFAMWTWLAWVLYLSAPGLVAPWLHAALAVAAWWSHSRIRRRGC